MEKRSPPQATLANSSQSLLNFPSFPLLRLKPPESQSSLRSKLVLPNNCFSLKHTNKKHNKYYACNKATKCKKVIRKV